jgi:hypothetical protein
VPVSDKALWLWGRLRAERKAGQLLARMEKARGGRPTETNATRASVSTLKDLGVTPRQPSDWQALGEPISLDKDQEDRLRAAFAPYGFRPRWRAVEHAEAARHRETTPPRPASLILRHGTRPPGAFASGGRLAHRENRTRPSASMPGGAAARTLAE